MTLHPGQKLDSPFWVSWYGVNGTFELHSPWWISGTRCADDADVFCAAVMASDEEGAKRIVRAAHDNPLHADALEWRFVEEMPRSWSPFSDRFPQADWMIWRPHTPVSVGGGSLTPEQMIEIIDGREEETSPVPGFVPTEQNDEHAGQWVTVPRKAVRSMTLAGCDRLPSVDGVFGVAGALCSNVWDAMVEEGEKLFKAHPVAAEGEVAGLWRPIETAPKDGQQVVLWCVKPGVQDYGTKGAPLAVIGNWDDGIWNVPFSDDWIEDSGFTHWMPMPLPPHEQEGTPSTCGTEACKAAVSPETTPQEGRIAELEAETAFLIDRLDDFSQHDMDEDALRDWHGHVAPSIARARLLLTQDSENA